MNLSILLGAIIVEHRPLQEQTNSLFVSLKLKLYMYNIYVRYLCTGGETMKLKKMHIRKLCTGGVIKDNFVTLGGLKRY